MKSKPPISPTGSVNSEVTHTLGPWKAHLNAPTAAIKGHLIKTQSDPETPIAVLWEGGGTHGKPRQVANARLIAAAPELLEALTYLVKATSLNDHLSHEESLTLQFETVDKARAAISKAKGL